METAADHVRVKLSGPYHLGTVERIIRDLTPLFRVDSPTELALDLSTLTFISPAALALLTAAVRRIEDLSLATPGSRVQMPRAEGINRYLLRMDFIKQLYYGEEVVDEPFKRKRPIGFRECRHFDTAESYPEVRKQLADAIAERCQTDDVSRQSLHVALDEVCENVLHHAGTGLGGFAAAQALTSKPVMEIAIADLGIGIRASLAKNPDYRDVASDVDAIATAMRPRVSSTPDRNSGIGLFVTSLLLTMNGGELLVRSGRGAVFQGSRLDQLERDVALPGTLVVLRVRTDRALNINEVYRALDRAITESVPDADHQGDHADASSG